MAELFSALTRELRDFLERILPKLSDNWWQDYVLAELSPQQVQVVEQLGVIRFHSLSNVDLSTLAFPFSLQNFKSCYSEIWLI